MDVDWTPVLTAAAAGLVGFGSAWLASRTTREQIRAENNRLRLQEEAEHRNHRQNYYHQTLEALERFRQMLTTVLEMQQGEFMPWLQNYRALTTGISLFGSNETAKLGDEMYALIMEIEEKALRPEAAAPFMLSAPLAETHADLMQRFDQLRSELVEAMRRDVAPN